MSYPLEDKGQEADTLGQSNQQLDRQRRLVPLYQPTNIEAAQNLPPLQRADQVARVRLHRLRYPSNSNNSNNSSSNTISSQKSYLLQLDK